MSEKNDTEKAAEAMIRAGKKMLDDARSIYAPCKNAYMEKGRDGHVPCDCWRCRPDWV